MPWYHRVSEGVRKKVLGLFCVYTFHSGKCTASPKLGRTKRGFGG